MSYTDTESLFAAMERRRFLKAAGVAIALPMFESLTPWSQAAAKKRPIKRMVVLSNNYGVYQDAFFPAADQVGRDYDMPETLKALEPHRADVTVFSNLDHGATGGHQGVPVLLSGVRYAEGNISMDQKAAEFVGSQTRYPSMTLKVNENNLVSFTRTGVQVPSIDVRQTYRALFLEDSPEAKAKQAERFQRHTSILDVVLGEAKSVNKDLGKQDQAKFEEYLDSVRTLEKKIEQQEPWLDKAKPATDYAEPKQSGRTEDDLKTMMELISLALQTDSTRAITLSSGFRSGDHGLNGGYHGFSHHGKRPDHVAALKKIEGHQIAMMAYLIGLLRKQEDTLNGGTLLDHTMVLFGCGMATGEHSNKNLPLVLAGGGFKHGEHKLYPGEKHDRVPAANLLLSMLQCYGLEIDRFGTSKGTLTDLEWA
ncbi:MAG: DUF1552 domain-containing protein [Planctomycetota bacterium]|jgi:hypothetical protein